MFQDEEEAAMIASGDSIEIEIESFKTEFAPGVGNLELKYKLSESSKQIVEKYPNEEFKIHFAIADKDKDIVYKKTEDASKEGVFEWNGYLNEDKNDSITYENGPYKLISTIMLGDFDFDEGQDINDFFYELVFSDSVRVISHSIDTSFNILNDIVKLDWIANSDEFSDLMAGNTSEWYEAFVEDWKEEGFFANEDATPLEWLKEHEVKTTSVKFVNATVEDIIKEFGMVIHAADSILKTDNPALYSNISSKYSGKHSGLNMRYISNSTSPSNHSIGAAVDFRVPQNPMYTSKYKKHTEFIKYITGVDLLKSKTAETVTAAHKSFMEKFHGKNYGSTSGKHNEILDKYILISNYGKNGKIALSDIEKIKDNEVIINDFLDNRQKLITALETHKSIIVFNETSKTGIDKLITHLNAVTGDTIPKLTDTDIQAFFKESKEFYEAITETGFADLEEFYTYFNKTTPNDNLLFEHGFCDIDIEVYNAFNKAHKLVSRKLINKELNIEWGGIYSSRIDGMHFSLNKELIIELTSEK